MTDQRVVVVTGGGAGIGAAIAEEIGRQGAFVVTMDPLVTLDGSEKLDEPQETTADRIVAAGGVARASAVSVTDGDGVSALFKELVDEFGRLDAVVNVAGISRPTSWTAGSEEDWRAVLEVHLDGYLNILAAALPIMAAAGHGNILGVTSGSGWRAGDAGAYGMAKRAVASLTWQLAYSTPLRVVVNAMSPIAMTRMVTAALERAGRGSSSAAAAGPLFGAMPEPEELGPIGAYLASENFTWCRGAVIFAGGSEVAVVDQPRLLEVVRSDDVQSLAHVLEAVTARTLVPSEASQLSSGGSTPRVGAIFDAPGDSDLPPAAVASCAIVSDRPKLAAAVRTALEARGVTCTDVTGTDDLLTIPALDAVVVAFAGPAASNGGWEKLLAEHAGIVDGIHTDARWARAAADYSVQADRPIRLVTLTDALTSGGRSRAQAFAQHARNARKATKDRVAAFAVSLELPGARDAKQIGELVAHLLCSPEAAALSGAELVAAPGWFGLRSHPRPSASITYGGPAIPDWLHPVLRTVIR